ncbi:13510_t:CDS:1, partial [Dentiscutata heterogama]
GKKDTEKHLQNPLVKAVWGKIKKKVKTTDSVEKENQETPIQKTPPHNISSQ